MFRVRNENQMNVIRHQAVCEDVGICPRQLVCKQVKVCCIVSITEEGRLSPAATLSNVVWVSRYD